MGDVYNWSTVLRTEYNVINDNCGAHRVNSLKVDVIVPLRGTYGGDGRMAYTHSGAASQLAVGFR